MQKHRNGQSGNSGSEGNYAVEKEDDAASTSTNKNNKTNVQNVKLTKMYYGRKTNSILNDFQLTFHLNELHFNELLTFSLPCECFRHLFTDVLVHKLLFNQIIRTTNWYFLTVTFYTRKIETMYRNVSFHVQCVVQTFLSQFSFSFSFYWNATCVVVMRQTMTQIYLRHSLMILSNLL